MKRRGLSVNSVRRCGYGQTRKVLVEVADWLTVGGLEGSGFVSQKRERNYETKVRLALRY